MESDFRIIADPGNRTLVILRGVIDSRNASLAGEAIRRAAWPGRDAVSVDVGGLAAIDGTGMRALVVAALDARRDGRPLALCGVQPTLIDRLRRNGFLDLFRVDTSTAGTSDCEASVRVVWKEERIRRPADVRYLPEIRHRIVRFCEAVGLDGELLDSLHLAAGEAVTNAIRHGCGEDDRLSVEACCAVADEHLIVEVHDPGRGFDPEVVGAPDPEELRPGGMGIFLMRAIMDDVQFRFTEGGTDVRMVKRLAAACGAGAGCGREGIWWGGNEPLSDE